MHPVLRTHCRGFFDSDEMASLDEYIFCLTWIREASYHVRSCGFLEFHSSSCLFRSKKLWLEGLLSCAKSRRLDIGNGATVQHVQRYVG